MPPPSVSASFYQDLERLEALAAAPVTSAAGLGRVLSGMYSKAANAEFAQYDIAALSKVAPDLIYRLFDLRLVLRSRIADFEARGMMTSEVTQGLRDVFRILRYVSDMLGEISIGHGRLAEHEPPLRGFTGTQQNTLVNDAFYKGSELPFQSGDVLLVRGRAHNSAAIARIGDVDCQFSHTGIVYIDDAGSHWLVESLIEDGAVISRLGRALEHGIVRAVLYRHKDTELAARAAKVIHDHVAQSLAFPGRRILYDFSMQLDERRRLFCSKLVRLAFHKASNGTYAMPSYPTKISLKNRDFLERIGVKTDKTYAPGDIDLEPAFDLVAEWQDYRETSHVRMQDFTMDKVFEWMDARGMRFEETAAIQLVSRLGRFSAYFSEGAKEALSSVLPKVPINMPRKTVAAVAMLHKTAEPICRELQELEWRCISETGLPLHGKEIFAALDAIRTREGNQIGYLVARG